MEKEEIIQQIKEMDEIDFRDVFAACRERHNDKMNNMKKYNVVIATSYHVEAEDEADAEEVAWEKFQEDLGTNSKLQFNLFGTTVEEE